MSKLEFYGLSSYGIIKFFTLFLYLFSLLFRLTYKQNFCFQFNCSQSQRLLSTEIFLMISTALCHVLRAEIIKHLQLEGESKTNQMYARVDVRTEARVGTAWGWIFYFCFESFILFSDLGRVFQDFSRNLGLWLEMDCVRICSGRLTLDTYACSSNELRPTNCLKSTVWSRFANN